MFQEVKDADFVRGEHSALKFWQDQKIFQKLRERNAGGPRWSFLDGPITANNPMGVHHAWGRTYKDTYQRFFAMMGYDQRYQNGFDCQGLWVEVEVEKQLGLGTKTAVNEYGIDNFVNECKRRVLTFAARQTEQSVRLGYWMDWDDPDQLRLLAEKVGSDEPVNFTAPSGKQESAPAHQIVERLGNPEWGGSYFTFSTENNETIWTFLKKCFTRGKIYLGHDVMPWSGRGGSAYSQMEIAEGRKLTTHKSCFVRFPLRSRNVAGCESEGVTGNQTPSPSDSQTPRQEYLLVWTTTPWTLTSNVAAAVNLDLDYVKLKANRDDAVYYFAKENLHFKRLEREFKEGFGRPEWKWPEGTPKLKTLAQIFKENGGFEELDTIKGAEMVGWEYDGPFDDLPAQQQPGGFPEDENFSDRCGTTCHRVIDGGRDSRGAAHVVAGEGTGIVHIAPGCGDIDHKMGAEHGIVAIAPLKEDGTYDEGFGDFTGREAISPETAELVFEKLKEKGLLVNVETYPHIYPHCWRTGDELVFRLVDEWFINMDWREEIKDVTRQIRWLPNSIDGQERECEWLSNMSDWMISKKRFWGLALPIWVDEESGDFEVMGSLAELKERAVEGWDDFEGNTPHRPWIDHVKIRNEKTGNLMTRIEDVGNPWLDAGIVPFSTLSYNRNHDEWQKWYPADLVTECFPGQFRNWFYSMLSLSTMMRYDETDDPAEKRPFKTLLGHRLVMDEKGQPMHKSDGTAIWFEEAAEQLGVDTMRWMYLAQNPATDLRFGTRHGDEQVTLETPDGPTAETKEGVPCCKVTSQPADEVRRRVLIPLWNSYAFFVNYARLDEFNPNAQKIPVADRPEIDRWVLSNLQSVLKVAQDEMPNFNAAAFCKAAEDFLDDLTNWYIRRNRRRFWRSRKVEGQEARDEGLIDGWDADKLAAYQTLYEVLVTLCKALAPFIPFLTERMYQNLVGATGEGQGASDAPQSVHLCEYPLPDQELLDPTLNARTATAQLVVKLGHKLREEKNLRVRLPLAELQFACASAEQREAIEHLGDVIREELNIKQISGADNLDDLVTYSFKPNLKTLGPRYGKLLGAIRNELPNLDGALLAPLRSGESVTVTLGGEDIELGPDDVMVSTEQATDWSCADEAGIQIAISTVTTPELEREGMARDFVRQVQSLRKDHDLEIQDRITVEFSSDDPEAAAAISEWDSYIREETLADSITRIEEAPDKVEPAAIGGAKASIWISRV
ncbi:MAG: class I tRNA ligase family protein [Planctomycetota bacterium]|nr:class I tRNA ligase family protein [Planctomycetota bacterium]MDA1252576.1 class I tRNA ligase family protein [Planctomycetota bacterium]